MWQPYPIKKTQNYIFLDTQSPILMGEIHHFEYPKSSISNQQKEQKQLKTENG